MLNHPIHIKKLFHAQTITGRAGTDRIVKRKQSRFQFIEAVVTHRAGKLGGKHLIRLVFIHIADCRQPLGEGQGGFKRLG